ncbi:MAG: hypothetical protein WEB50_05275 [Vicinamibacterales bacterium]
MRRTFYGTMLLAAALAVAGCDNEIENRTPTEPAPTTTDTFTGTININGAATHTFTTVAAGLVTATLATVAPDPAIQVGLGLGTWNGTNCQITLPKDDAVQGNAVIGQVSGPGALCARIYDVGKMTEALTYTVTVVHP